MTKKNLKRVLAMAAIVVAGCGERQAGNDAAEPAVGSPASPASPAIVGQPEAAEDATSPAPDGSSLGPALADPERYYGVYAEPGRPGRAWFITEATRPAYAERAPEVPPGHLMLGAMFGDVAPWQLKTLSRTEFVQAYPGSGQSEPVAIEFRLDANGEAAAFRFTAAALGDDEWLERTGDLPDGW